MKQVLIIPFTVGLMLPAAILGFLWRFITLGFEGGAEYCEQVLRDLDE